MDWVFGKARYAYDCESITKVQTLMNSYERQSSHHRLKSLSEPIWDMLDRGMLLL